MANQVAKFNEAAMPPPPAVKDFINGVSRAVASKDKPAPVHDAGLSANQPVQQDERCTL